MVSAHRPSVQAGSNGAVRSSRWAPHELSLVLLGFLLPLGAGTKPAVLADTNLKIAVAVLGVWTCAVSLLVVRQGLGQHVRSAVPPVVTYALLVAIPTFTLDLPKVRFELFFLMPVAVLGLFGCERY